jgi:hypothetical protein
MLPSCCSPGKLEGVEGGSGIIIRWGLHELMWGKQLCGRCSVCGRRGNGMAIVLLKTAFEPEVKNISQIDVIYDVNSNLQYAVHACLKMTTTPW